MSWGRAILTSLDELYGRSLLPSRRGPHEHLRQGTWLKVDDSSANRLKAYLEHTQGDAYLARLLAENYNTLWLVDDDGQIRIAIEEVVVSQDPLITTPMPRSLLRPESKLGHPSLVEGGAARVGGELAINPNTGVIYLSNKSGRYGIMRTKQELENAAKLFARLGIDTVVSYESPTL